MLEFGPQSPRILPRQDWQVLALQMDHWTRARAGHQRWAEQARDCVRFAEGDQYSAADLAALEAAQVPALTLNKIGPLIRLMWGFFRQNRYEIRYQAGSDGTGDPAVADVLTAISKHVDTANRSKWLDAEVFDDGLVTSRGFWDIRLDFSSNVLGEIRETVLDPFSVYIDPEADSYDPESWNHVSISKWCSLDDIQLTYGRPAEDAARGLQDGAMAVAGGEGDAGGGDEISPARFFGGSDPFDQGLGSIQIGAANLPLDDMINRGRKLVRVIETQHRKLRRIRRFVDLTTGQIRVIPDHWDDARIQAVLQWATGHGGRIITDQALVKGVRVTVTAANVVLYDDWSFYNRFTVVPFFPQFRRGQTKGMVADLIDPQREINKRRSAMLQVLMTAANSGWMYEENAITEATKQALETHGGAPGINIAYKTGAPPPQRIEVAQVPQAFVVAEDKATADLREIAGINEAAMGLGDKVLSGRAIEARQRSAYVGAEMYFDNFARAQELKGRLRLEIIQNYYTEARLFRVPDATGQDRQLTINWQAASGEIVNDVSSGSYHVTIDSAPISSTFQQGAFEEAKELAMLGVPIPNEFLLKLSSIPLKQAILDAMQAQMAQAQAQAASQGGAAGMGSLPPQALAAQAALVQAQQGPQIAAARASADLQKAAIDNRTRLRIAEARIQADSQIQAARLLQTDKLERAKLEIANGGLPPDSHDGSIAGMLRRNADQAFAAGDFRGSNEALEALDKIVGPLSPGATDQR